MYGLLFRLSMPMNVLFPRVEYHLQAGVVFWNNLAEKRFIYFIADDDFIRTKSIAQVLIIHIFQGEPS